MKKTTIRIGLATLVIVVLTIGDAGLSLDAVAGAVVVACPAAEADFREVAG